ncbi:MAG: C69 family dipeptidase, partial [Bacilli bacterium]|nr:C69 family dipeptidase [Bacilli bacterium]
MACTTILVGKKASYDGSTMIARNDDGRFDTKKLIVVNEDKQPKIYKSKIGHLSIELPSNPLRYTCTPNVVTDEDGIWAANGINSENVAMTATETITNNALVLGADPYVKYKKADKKGEKDIAGGLGEEDFVIVTLPYIRSAREGVLRLGELLEKYGTYESNGIAFSDKDEIWWLETIGGHHWIARRVKDEEYVIMPNQLGIDFFDFDDAFGDQRDFLCSKDLKEFIINNHLDCNQNEHFNPRLAFGTHDDSDHVYNTPRAWYMGRYFNPTTYKWDGDNADYSPESDNIPWSLVPEKKITVEEVKYILSSYYQGTPYNPYSSKDNPLKGKYRPIGVSRTDVMAILQIRPYMPKEIQAIEWICFGCNAFNVPLPLYANVTKMPKYVSEVTKDVSTNDFYWSSRIFGALADAHFGTSIMFIERYQKGVAALGHELINKCDKEFIEKKDTKLLEKANDIAA